MREDVKNNFSTPLREGPVCNCTLASLHREDFGFTHFGSQLSRYETVRVLPSSRDDDLPRKNNVPAFLRDNLERVVINDFVGPQVFIRAPGEKETS
jgi:hypothetical protein